MSDKRTIFKKIIDGDVPADIVYQDNLCLAFRDVAPQAPVHLLVIPRKEIQSLAHLQPEDQALMGHMMLVIQRLASEHGLENGFRVVTNCGREGGQSVDHLHFHLLGRRPLKWPPG
ncbi:MAG TPA: histidine triad nucleotide-binding protein [Pirellulaceae bacterium]|nr:histidine triad nucleotide-binding protein [Pirellulaceae bacterium]